MKTFKRLFIIIFLLTNLFCTYSQTIHSSLKNKFDVNEKNGTVRAVYNIYERQSGFSTEEKAKNYLKKNKNLFGMQSDLNDLVLNASNESIGTKHFNFKQYYKGMEVINSSIIVSLDKDDFITMVVCDYFPIKNLRMDENLNETAATSVAREQIKNASLADITFRSSKKIYIDGDLKPHLIWDLLAYVKKVPYEIYYIDAHTGDILQKKPAGFGYTTGSGQVFNPDPGSYLRDSTLNANSNISSAYKSVSLPNLLGNGYLQGQNAHSFNDLGDENIVYNSGNNFNFTRTQLGFKETNAYYFIDQFLTYVHDLGFNPFWRGDYSSLYFDAAVPYVEGTSCTYYPQNNMEFIYMGYNRDTLTTAITGSEDESVIVHECGHALHDALISGGITTTPPGGTATGISEGIADYIGISFRRSLQPSNPFRPNARSNYYRDTVNPGIRDINSANYSLWSSSTDRGKASIWSSTLMDIEYNVATNPAAGIKLGRDKTTKLLLKSLSYINENSTIADYINAMFQADRDLYSGADLAVLEQVYRNRGFLSSYEVSGTINQNTTWSSYRVVTGDVTVASGVTLTISENTFVYFDSNKKITVNGTLNATSSTFTSAYTWGGIQFNSGSSGNINYSTVTNASQGIYIYETSALSISNTEISNCSGHGIYVYRTNYSTQPIISNCIIHDNSNSSGIVMYWSSPDITGCNIYNNYNGLGIADYSSPRLGYTSVAGNNNVHNNTNVGVYPKRYSSPLLGRNLSPFQGGNNIIASNTFRDAQAEEYCYVYAENNWWGSAPPNSSKIAALSGSTIDYDPYLSSQPNLSWFSPDAFVDSKNVLNNIIYTVPQIDNILKVNSSYIEPANIDPEISYSIYQLNSKWNQSKGSDLISFKSYLKELSDKKDKKMLYAAAKLIIAGYEKEKRISMVEEVISDYNGQPIVETALMNKFLYYFNEVKDYKMAESVMKEIELKFPGSSALEETKEHFSILSSSLQQNYNTFILQNRANTSMQREDYLIENYPNPFNPTTKISFTIPEKSQIKLRVFDILGREITILADGVYEAGKYEVEFNAKTLSSGVYFYNLTTGKSSITKKMLLVK